MFAGVSVSHQMRLQVRPLVEALVANRALVRRLFHVEDLVNRQRPRLAETFPAFCTLERLFFRVNVSGKIENKGQTKRSTFTC